MKRHSSDAFRSSTFSINPSHLCIIFSPQKRQNLFWPKPRAENRNHARDMGLLLGQIQHAGLSRSLTQREQGYVTVPSSNFNLFQLRRHVLCECNTAYYCHYFFNACQVTAELQWRKSLLLRVYVIFSQGKDREGQEICQAALVRDNSSRVSFPCSLRLQLTNLGRWFEPAPPWGTDRPRRHRGLPSVHPWGRIHDWSWSWRLHHVR